MPVAKGGVWTNIEDEVLKAAISKYGLNQWARVSSLLARKTPKQCKARWNEWLDPGIRKVEWSREEDERLLHLAKIMPTQWRSIAPIVGRTATQCLERYQKLLDEAESRENEEFGLGGPAGGEALAPSADDVRRLRPGELDPDPENKPARPDTIDMDEDEKEMLSEARARLANTQGKKAKRKARERQLEESRRLALLQKRRELKNAGINTKITYRKKGQMDYNADIPFERKPAPGFYDTTDEIERNEKQRAAFDPKKQQLANKRKPDEEDGQERKRKKDNKQDGPSAAAVRAAQLQKIREAERSSGRRVLNLPAPQVSEGELEDIVKVGLAGDRATKQAEQGDNIATRGMVGKYNSVQQTPIRTPRAHPQEDRIVNEIKNIRAMTETKSSLLGGENAKLIEGTGSTGFDSATPRQQAMSTPNPLATPSFRDNGAGSISHSSATPIRPARDTYNLNSTFGAHESEVTPQDARSLQQVQRNKLRDRLATLPKPKDSEWELELPEIKTEIPTDGITEEDSLDRDKRLNITREAQREAELRRQTQAIQRSLPLPTDVQLKGPLATATPSNDIIDNLIVKEIAALIANDLRSYPLPGTKAREEAPLQSFSDNELSNARLTASEDLSEAVRDKRISLLFKFWDANNIRFTPLLHSLLPRSQLDDQVRSAHSYFDSFLENIVNSAQKSNAVEKKLALHLGGYKKRSEALKSKTSEAHTAFLKASMDQETAATAIITENGAIATRLESLREEVSLVARMERHAQEEHRIAKETLVELKEGLKNGIHR